MTRSLGERQPSTLVMIHGQPGSSQDWSRVARRLPQSYDTQVYDRPGWGMSDTAAQGILGNTRVLRQRLMSLGGVPCTLVGSSFGAAIAVALAAMEPQLVHAMVLVSPAANRQALVAADHLLALPGVGAVSSLVGLRAYERFHASLGWGTKSHESFRLEQSWMLRELEEVEEMSAMVQTPTVILGGTRDRVIPFRSYESLARRLTNAQLRVVIGGSHRLAELSPTEVVLAICAVEELKESFHGRNNSY